MFLFSDFNNSISLNIIIISYLGIKVCLKSFNTNVQVIAMCLELLVPIELVNNKKLKVPIDLMLTGCAHNKHIYNNVHHIGIASAYVSLKPFCNTHYLSTLNTIELIFRHVTNVFMLMC